MKLAEYQDRFKTALLSRDASGVLEIRLHSAGESLRWGGRPHRELPELFASIASDRENRVTIITGTGQDFIRLPDTDSANDLPRGRATATVWDQIIFEGCRLLEELLKIEVPIIAAVNGPVTVHSEIAVLCDIVLCTPDTYFQDDAHFSRGLVPGDGVHVIWPALLGPNRGRQFLLGGTKLFADEAQRLGVVAELVSHEQLLDRAHEFADRFASMNPVTVRNSRRLLIRPIRRAIEDDLHAGLALEALASLAAKDWYRDQGIED